MCIRDRFSKFFVNRPIFATVLALLIVVAGLVALNILPVAQFPEITPPTVHVSAVYPGANAETAVSYTHLDVYKRQPQERALPFEWVKERVALPFDLKVNRSVPFSEERLYEYFDDLGPVSYTHLDVYKRQILLRVNVNVPLALSFTLPIF